jgi:hypothetical protein
MSFYLRFAIVAMLIFAASAFAEEELIVPQVRREKVIVVVHWMSQNRVKEICSSMGAWGGVKPNVSFYIGCNAYHHDTNVCDVYLSDPRNLDDSKTTVLGHEVLHCFIGAYHEQVTLN